MDQCARQPLRATTDTLLLFGPGPRVGAYRDGRPTSLILKRWPVLQVTQIQIAPNRMPWQFTTIPATEYSIAYPVQGMYGSSAPAAAGEGGQEVLLNPGWVKWDRSHSGYVLQVTNNNGWPHAGLTAAAAQGATALQVDDCTAWVITSPFTGEPVGATGTVYDAGSQEVVHVTAASATAGPGTLTLSASLQNQHAAGTIVSSLPQSATWAAMLFAIEQALERGATATTIMEVPGRVVAQGAGVDTSYGTPASWAEKILETFARII